MFIHKSFFTTLFLLAADCNANRFNATKVSTAAASAVKTAVTASQTAAILNATVANCFVTVPNNPLTAAGLSTPYLLQPPCSMSVGTQQAFVEAAIFDPATGAISIYHPLITDANIKPAVAPVVPVLPAGAVVGLWFGYNGGVLSLLDTNGKDTNNSPLLKGADCINGLPGTQNDVFGQVSWCNAQAWFAAANAGVASGKTVIPDLGVDSLGNACPTSRSFEITDACPSDNVPTQYILLPNGATAQDTAANNNAITNGTVINNASDEALLTHILDPLIGCTAFLAPSLTDPGAMVSALALSELQASAKQLAPIGLVPINDPDCLLTATGAISLAKTNAYRLGVNQPIITAGSTDGALVPYCQNMVAVQPPFLKGFQTKLTNTASPDLGVGNNLFTFLSARFLMSLTQLGCTPAAVPFQPVVCKFDGNGAATACTITLAATSSTAKVAAVSSSPVKASSSIKAATTVAAVSVKASSSAGVSSAVSKASSSIKAATTAAAVSVKASSSAGVSSTVSKASSIVAASAKSSVAIASVGKSTSALAASAKTTAVTAAGVSTSIAKGTSVAASASMKASLTLAISAQAISVQANSTIAKATPVLATSVKANATIAKATSILATSAKVSSIAKITSVVGASAKANATIAKVTSAIVKANSTSLGAKLVTTLAPTKATTALAVATTAAKTTTILVEVITVFIFFLSLGGTAPGVLPANGGQFIVLEEIFVDMQTAASKACTLQFNTCAALAGVAFAGTDCLTQLQACNGVASTAVPASTPATITATATVPASSVGVNTVAGVVQTAGPGSVVAGASCPVAKALTVSACSATVTVTKTVVKPAGTGVGTGVGATGTVGPRHLNRHIKGRAFGKY